MSTTICYETGSDNPSEDQMHPSLSGRHSGRSMNIAFFDQTAQTISEKDFALCETFRNAHNNTMPHAKQQKAKKEQSKNEPSLLVSPNPSSGAVTMQFKISEPFKTYHFTIIDVLGKEICSISGNALLLNNAGALELQKLVRGIYIVAFYDQNRMVITQKIIRL